MFAPGSRCVKGVVHNHVSDMMGHGPERPPKIPEGTDDVADPAIEYLEQLSLQLVVLHNNAKDPKSQALLRQHLSPDFQMLNSSLHECSFPAAMSLDEHIQNTIAFKEEHPQFFADVNNATAVLEQSGNDAVVWLTERGCNAKDEIYFNRESVSILYWRRESGEWKWYKHFSIRGGGDMFRKG